MRTILLGCGLVICLILVTLLANESSAQELVLDSLMAEAIRVNPDLKAAELRYKAFEAQVPQAGSLPNPMFQATLTNISTKSDRAARS